MYDSRLSSVVIDEPVALEDACIDYICDNLDELTSECEPEEATAVSQASNNSATALGRRRHQHQQERQNMRMVSDDSASFKRARTPPENQSTSDNSSSTMESPSSSSSKAENSRRSTSPELPASSSSGLSSSSSGARRYPVVLRFNRPTLVYLPSQMSEALLSRMSERGMLNDLRMTLFHPSTTKLFSVRIRDGSRLSSTGLRMLRGHRIKELEVNGVTQATVTDIIGCLSDYSLTNLYKLNVAGCTFVDKYKNTVMVAISKLQNLHTLNVSSTEFSKASLEMIVDDLPLLENINISCTKVTDFSCLRKCKDRLKSLIVYNLKLSPTANESFPEVLSELSQLRILDISEEPDSAVVGGNLDIPESGKTRVARLLQRLTCLPNLMSLDISGNENVKMDDLLPFLNSHPSLSFLGLVCSEHCKIDSSVEPNIHPRCCEMQVAGSADEQQVLEALQRYTNRPQYTQKSLFNLFRLTQGYKVVRPDLIKAVIRSAHRYQTVFQIQMAATACLYNLSKSDIGQRLHPAVLRQIVEVDLNAMREFPQHQQLQKNVLLTICSDRILQDVKFNRYLCAKLVMDCLCNYTDDSMNRMSVAICSILAAKITTRETSELGSRQDCMSKLLTIVRSRMDVTNIDITLKFTLSALWNLTDESPQTCETFLKLAGLKLFLQVLETFPGEMSIETKVLGLLNNIAEVNTLREHLLVDAFISLLIKLMHSKHIDVSYFAAGIVAHLASDTSSKWSGMFMSKGELLNDLCFVVMNWKTPREEMVAYRSFRPFFPLMEDDQPYAVQLWAVWAINHVCAKNPTRYCPMFIEEGGDGVILSLLRNPVTHNSVVDLCNQIVFTLSTQKLIPDEILEENQRILQEVFKIEPSSSDKTLRY